MHPALAIFLCGVIAWASAMILAFKSGEQLVLAMCASHEISAEAARCGAAERDVIAAWCRTLPFTDRTKADRMSYVLEAAIAKASSACPEGGRA